MLPSDNPLADPLQQFRFMYETLRRLLERNYRSLQILADLEADLGHLHYSSKPVRRAVKSLLEEGLLMAEECNILCDGRYPELFEIILRLSCETRSLTEHPESRPHRPLSVALTDDDALDKTLVGGKAGGIAALRQIHRPAVPPGFVFTTAAYRAFLEHNGLPGRIQLLLEDIELTVNERSFSQRTGTIRRWIREAVLPDRLKAEMDEQLGGFRSSQDMRWAVRSSGVMEDGESSFAGLHETELNVSTRDLVAAYLQVTASRFLDRAVLYRIHRGLAEIDTPMAVIFMPMVDAAASGVLYTCDPADPLSDTMKVFAVPGLGDRVVRGLVEPAMIGLTREPNCCLLADPDPPPGDSKGITTRRQGRHGELGRLLSESVLTRLGDMAFKVRESFGYDLDIEWALDRSQRIHLLQARRFVTPKATSRAKPPRRRDIPLIEGGTTIFPGRAEGEICHLTPESDSRSVPRGAVVVVEQPRPDLAPILFRAAALIAVGGSPVGHLATLAREFSVPSIYQMRHACSRLSPGTVVSVDATSRRVFQGSRWPGMRERVMARIATEPRLPRSGPLYDLVLALNLLDPDAPSFKARSCRSLHDTIRFTHEMSVREMFAFGDEQSKGWQKKSHRLKTSIPMVLHIISLDEFAAAPSGSVAPDRVMSTPFRAFWSGFTDHRLAWPRRWDRAMSGVSRDFQDTILGAHRGPRRPGSANYVMVARDYLNFNARFTYHYAMVDAIIGPGSENNQVYFTFRGGGGSAEGRAHRSRFLEIVLRNLHFDVDRRGDTLVAWLRRYSRPDTEFRLAQLGRLIVCSRELDASLHAEHQVEMYAHSFLEERYGLFG